MTESPNPQTVAAYEREIRGALLRGELHTELAALAEVEDRAAAKSGLLLAQLPGACHEHFAHEMALAAAMAPGFAECEPSTVVYLRPLDVPAGRAVAYLRAQLKAEAAQLRAPPSAPKQEQCRTSLLSLWFTFLKEDSDGSIA